MGLEPEIRQHQEFVEKKCGGQLSNHVQPTIVRTSWDFSQRNLRRFFGKPSNHGQHWPGQCFPLFFRRNSWKTLARPMFSMNFWSFLDFGLVPELSLENHKFMENIGQANDFHCFFTEIHGKHWPGQWFSMNSGSFLDFGLVSGDSLENHQIMDNIGQANAFHCFFAGIHGKHWPGQCFP